MNARYYEHPGFKGRHRVEIQHVGQGGRGIRWTDEQKAKIADRVGEKAANYKHGFRHSPTYNTWAGILQRCNNSNNPSWPNYGGRGIAVCERWRTFENFLADMGERPEGLTIDRIDNDGNYEPGNCRWANKRQQMQNRHTNAEPGVRGFVKSKQHQ